MTAKQEKDNFITHYLEDWIPKIKQPETIQMLNELIENYCKEQREILSKAKLHGFPSEIEERILNAKMPEL